MESAIILTYIDLILYFPWISHSVFYIYLKPK